MYIFFNNNPQGLKIGDCVVRAISATMNQSWERTYIDLCIEGFTFRDMPNANNVWDSYLKSKGFKRYVVPNTCPDCYRSLLMFGTIAKQTVLSESTSRVLTP